MALTALDGTASAQRAISAMQAKVLRGLIHGDTRQFLCQLMGATIYAIWAFGATFAVFWIVNKVKSMRVTPESEEEGLDVPEFGMSGYPEDAVVPTPY
jgi:ammonium transporter, Amt family